MQTDASARGLTPGRFRRDESGTATVEAVLWLPIFLILFGLMIDVGMIFNGQSKVLRVVQDANRNFSIGRLKTETEVEDFIDSELARHDISTNSTVASESSSVVVTTVTVPASQFQLLGYFTSLLELEIEVRSAHILEGITEAELDTLAMAP